MFSLESFHKKYETDEKKIGIRGRQFTFLMPRSLDSFVNPQDIFDDFPLWSKIWEASMVLADHLAGMTVDPHKSFLEIGCGIGLVGIVAASFGHRVMMTENNPNALDFAHANAATNDVYLESNLEIRELDWNTPQLKGTYDYVIGSEVVYKESDFPPILKLFKTYLKDRGEIILVEGMRKTSMAFFHEMGSFFDIRAQKKALRSESKKTALVFAEMKFKD